MTTTPATETTSAFKVGRTYYVRSICDYDCIFRYTVTRRTAQTVTLIDAHGGKPTRRKVRVWDGVEVCDPQGQFSMSPTLSADRYES